MHRPYLLLLLLLGLILFFLPISSSQYSRFKDCDPAECKGVKISYPFRVEGQPEYCSPPGFMLTCEDDGPLLNLHQDSYSVRDIDYLNHNLSIANKYFESNQCPEPTTNLTLNSTPFYFTPEVRNLFFYLCTIPSFPQLSQLLSVLFCSSNETMIGFFAVHEITQSWISVPCKAPLLVPVLESSLPGLPLNDWTLKEALQKGFSLTWPEDGCGDCESSGGRCGYNSSTMTFLCFCNDKDYPAIWPFGLLAKWLQNQHQVSDLNLGRGT